VTGAAPQLVQDLIAAIGTSDAIQTGPIRVGVDVVVISEFTRILSTTGGNAMTRTAFTEAERLYCARRPDRFAVRWAAKEAVAKAVGTGFRGLRPGDIEVLHHPDGRPSLRASDGSVWPTGAHAWDWSLTLCHEGDVALALAVARVPPDWASASLHIPEPRCERGVAP